MIIYSSNLATNLLIEVVNAKNITQTIRNLGATDIQVLRGVEDSKAYSRGIINTTTAYDLMVILEKLALQQIFSPEASKDMIKILLNQKHKEVIPALLPENVVVAHKTGYLSNLHHDAGIVFLPDGRKYVLVLLSSDLKDFNKGTRLLAEASEIIYNYMI